VKRRSTIERKFEEVLAAYSLTPEFLVSTDPTMDAGAFIRSSAALSIAESPNERGLKVSPMFTTFAPENVLRSWRLDTVAISAKGCIF
jgi:hypothetical protein